VSTTINGRVQSWVRNGFCDVFGIGQSLTSAVNLVGAGAHFRTLATAYRWQLDVEVDYTGIVVEAVRVVAGAPLGGTVYEGKITKFSSGASEVTAELVGSAGTVKLRLTLPDASVDPAGAARAANWVAALGAAAGSGARMRVPGGGMDNGVASGVVEVVPGTDPLLTGRALHDHELATAHFHSHDDLYASIAALTALTNRVGTLETSVANLTTQLNAVNSQLAGLQTSVGSVATDVATTKTNVSALQARRITVVETLSWTVASMPVPSDLVLDALTLPKLFAEVGGKDGGPRDVRLVQLTLAVSSLPSNAYATFAERNNVAGTSQWPFQLRRYSPAYGATYVPGIADVVSGVAVFTLNGT
jgi:hypothetical protein